MTRSEQGSGEVTYDFSKLLTQEQRADIQRRLDEAHEADQEDDSASRPPMPAYLAMGMLRNHTHRRRTRIRPLRMPPEEYVEDH